MTPDDLKIGVLFLYTVSSTRDFDEVHDICIGTDGDKFTFYDLQKKRQWFLSKRLIANIHAWKKISQ